MVSILRIIAFIGIFFGLGNSYLAAQAPVANFGSGITSGCSPIVVQFTDLSTNNPTAWAWDLGNGTLSTVQNPSTTYITPGSYTVTLTASNGAGSNTKTSVAYITAYPTPTIAFTATDLTPGCSSKTVQFNNQSTLNSTGTGSYYWDFGDGITSTVQNPSHVYAAPGNYSVSLVVTNGVGCNAVLTKTNYITVLPKPVAAFIPGNNNSCTSPLTATFTNTSSGATSYIWDFGDGGSSTATSPNHAYVSPGSYTVRLIAISTGGCRDTLTMPAAVNIGNLNVSFTSSTSNGCTGNNIGFTNTSTPGAGNSTWYFGDGGTSTVANPLHIYTTPGTYTVKLVVNYNNCADSTTRTITVISGAATAFTGAPLYNCQAPLTTNFSNTTTGAVSYLWLFGDGGTSTAANPAHTYTAPGSYTVKLISTSSNGCVDTLTKPAYVVISAPTATISYNGTDGGCIPLVKTFTANVNSVQPIVNYQWNFGDGSTGTGATAAHTYTTAGNFFVTLTYTTSGGCTNMVTTLMTTGQHAVLAFNANPTTVCVGSPVTFTYSGTPVNVLTWLFGDGGSSNILSPVYSYNAPGTYSVTLISNTNQCVDSLTKVNLITVQPPLANFTTGFSCAAQLTYSFTNTSIGATSYLWDFGDGSTSTAVNPPHTFASSGNYTVTLTAFNSVTGCTHSKTVVINAQSGTAQFTAAVTSVCPKTPVIFTIPANAGVATWTLYFGDNTSSNVSPGSVSHSYASTGTYTVKLVVTSLNGCKDSLTRPNYIAVTGPHADFISGAGTGCFPLTVPFTNTSTPFAGAPIASVLWNFGDGSTSTSTANTVAHTYIANGVYTVRLVVTDVNGCKDTIVKTNHVIISNPVASFFVSNVNACSGVPVQFFNAAAGNGPFSFSWDFGDNTTGTGGAPSHIYSTPGTYDVRFIVTDGSGCKDTLIRPAYINVSTVTAGFTTNDTLGFCPPYSVNLTNASSGNATSYLWDFGNGNTSTSANPTAVYTAAGNFVITLKAFNANGCVDSMKKTIQVNAGPTGTLIYSPVSGCLPLTVAFSATSVNTTSLVWDFSNGITQTTTGNSLTYTYTTPGAFVPKLILTNVNGCSTAILGIDTIKINKVSAGFIAAPSSVCVGLPVTFVDTSKTVTSPVLTRNWSFGDATSGTGALVSHAYATPGTYTVRLIAGAAGGCADTSYRLVVVNPLPVITGTNQAVCSGDSVALLAGGAATYVWSPATGLSCSACANPYARPTATTVYTITGTNGLGCVGTKQLTVKVNPLPTVSAGATQTICNGTTAQLLATGASSYVWSPATGLSSTTIANPVANPSTTTTYTVTGTAATGCVNTAQVTVNVIPNPTLTVTPNQTICIGNATTLTASGAASYTWSPGTGLNTTTGNTVTATPTVTTTYTVLGNTSSNGCQTAGSVTVTVNPLPVINPGSNRAICAGDSTTLTTTGAATYTWSPATGLSCTTCASPKASPAATTTYTVTGTSAALCVNTAQITVTVNPRPVVSASGNAAICSGANTTLSASGAATYVWSPATGLSCTTCASPVALPTATTTYTVVGTSAAGCKDSTQLTVTVNPLPVVSGGPAQFICPGASGVTLNGTGAVTYVWSPATGLSCTACASPVATPATTTTYKVVGTNANGCKDSANVIVNVNGVPSVTVAGNRSVCIGDSTQLTANGANSYVWSPATGLSCTTCANPYAKPAATTTYTVTGTSGVGCTGTTLVTVTVNPLPVVSAGNNQAICAGAITPLLATGASTYVWSPAAGLSCTACANPSANPSATTTYTVTGTSAAGCIASAQTTVTVNPLPVVSGGPNQFICPGTNTTLNATGAATYVWSPAAGLSCTNCASPVASPAATTTYTVVGTNANGCIGTATVTVNVNAVPVVNVTGNAPLCAGDSTLLAATGANTYVWSPAAGLSCTACATPFAKPASTTTYTVTGTSGVGCSGIATVTVTVNPIPAISAGPAQAICIGASANLAASGAATYVWTPAATLSNANIANPVATPTVTTTYVVTGTSVAGCVRKDSVQITVNARPTVATAGAGICPGGSANLLATGAVSYVWSPATGLSNAAIANPVASPATTTTYTVTGTGANGCTASATATVTVNPVPVVTLTGSRSICAGSVGTALVASGATSFVWTPATGLSCTNCANPTANPGATTTYTVTGTSGVGCSASTLVTINVNTPPVVTTGPAQTMCAGASVSLSAAGALSYNWSPAAGLSNTNISNPNASPLATTTYIVTGTDANGCTGKDSVKVTVNALPVVDAGPDTAICGLTAAQLHATGAQSYVWTPASTLSSDTSANPVATPAATTTYTVVGTGANGCTKADNVTVTIYAQPPVNAGPDQTICAGQTAQLQASGAATYTWAPGATLTCTACPNPKALPLANTTYMVVGTDVHGCNDSDKVTISIINRGPVTIAPGGDICEGETFRLLATGGTAYAWTPENTLSDPAAADPLASPRNTTTYQVLIKQGNCFTDTLSATVTVHPIPTVYAGDDKTVLAGSSVKITPAVTNVASYVWSPAEGLSCTTCPEPVATPLKTTTYKVNVASDFGCTASDDITLFVTCDAKQLWLPNTFTPNADGQNDRFYPHGRGITTVKRFRIYDRWGELIYDITNMPVDDANYGWDGTYKNQPLKPDVYVYIVNAECTTGEPVEIKGDISLIR